MELTEQSDTRGMKAGYTKRNESTNCRADQRQRNSMRRMDQRGLGSPTNNSRENGSLFLSNENHLCSIRHPRILVDSGLTINVEAMGTTEPVTA